jgi:hypothetical protein
LGAYKKWLVCDTIKKTMLNGDLKGNAMASFDASLANVTH